MKLRPHYILLMIYVITSGCTDPLIFDQGIPSSHLVVDGFITDAMGPHHIVLSSSASFSGSRAGGQELPVEGACVTIFSSNGEEIKLREFKPGDYITPDNFQGNVGSAYTLEILIDDLDRYVSTPQVLTQSSPIDSIHYFLTDQVDLDDDEIRSGYDINYTADFRIGENELYYKWDWEETYMFPTLCKTEEHIVCSESNLVDENPPVWCYVNDSLPPNFINLIATEEYSTNSIENHEITSMKYNFKYNRRYSLNLLKYNIGEEIYEYWKLAERQVKSTGSIFDPTPAAIVGNITNSNDPNEIVLGYFGAFGVSSKRIFINPLEFAKKPEEIMCPNIVTFHQEGVGSFCDDCRWWANGTGVRPDFWVD